MMGSPEKCRLIVLLNHRAFHPMLTVHLAKIVNHYVHVRRQRLFKRGLPRHAADDSSQRDSIERRQHRNRLAEARGKRGLPELARPSRFDPRGLQRVHEPLLRLGIGAQQTEALAELTQLGQPRVEQRQPTVVRDLRDRHVIEPLDLHAVPVGDPSHPLDHRVVRQSKLDGFVAADSAGVVDR